MTRLGNHVAISGNMNNRAPITIKLARKGTTPEYIVLKGTPVMFFTIKTLTATGGIMDPTMSVIPTKTPNHIGSYPSFTTAGKRIGVMRITNAISSIKEPPNK
jgi:hypothetical protein